MSDIPYSDLITKAQDKADKLNQMVYIVESTPFEYWFATDKDNFSTNNVLCAVFPYKGES